MSRENYQAHEAEINPEEVKKMELGIITKLGEKIGLIPRILVLLTALSLNPSCKRDEDGASPNKSSGGIIEHEYTREEFEAIKKNPANIIYYANDFISVPGLDLAQEISKAAKVYPGEFLRVAWKLTVVKELDLAKEISQAAEAAPDFFIENSPNFVGIPGLDLAQKISRVARVSPEGFLLVAGKLWRVEELDLAKEISKAAKMAPAVFLSHFDEYASVPGLDLAQEITQAAERDPGMLLFVAWKPMMVKGLDLAHEITQAAEKVPENFIIFFEGIRKYFPERQGLLLLEKSFESCPEMIIRSRSSLEGIKAPQLPSTKVLKEIGDPRLALLLDGLVKGDFTESEGERIIDDKEKFLRALIKIKARPGHLGKVSVEKALRDVCLEEVKLINDRHDESDAERFGSVNDLTAGELFTLMVYGEEEIFTSSFNGLFDRLLKMMNHEGIDGSKLLDQVGRNKFRIFVKLCAGFNRLNEFLKTMDYEKARQLLSAVVSDIEKSPDKLAQATAVADIFGTITDQRLVEVLQKQIKLEYERICKDPHAPKDDRILYEILSGMFGGRAIVNENWIEEMSEKYRLGNLVGVKTGDLFDQSNTNIQRYFFYDDEDGKRSFENFLAQYQNLPDWEVVREKHFVIISSNKNGKKIEIYANLPGFEEEGSEAIDRLMKEKKITATVIVHRGHSYHADDTIGRIPARAKIVHLGSCGGYNNVVQVLEEAPNAQIISTKGVGTMLVNDPLLRSLNMTILSGKDVVWSEFWDEMRNIFGNNANFGDYVPPHRNLGVIFLRTYRQQLQK